MKQMNSGVCVFEREKKLSACLFQGILFIHNAFIETSNRL